MQHSTTIAVLGLGAMGFRMAQRLLAAGYPVRVYNRSEGPGAAARAAGATVCATPAEAARGADVVLSMVTDDEAAHTVWLDPVAGALAGARPGCVAIESSTVTPGWVATLADRASAAGLCLVEAPVAGSRPQAEAGDLVFFVAGDREAVARVEPLFDILGRHQLDLGATPGAAARVKLAVNMLFATQVVAMAEVLGGLAREGLEPAQALAVLGELPVTSAAARGAATLIAQRRHAAMFPVRLVKKDLGYFSQAFGPGNTPLADAVAQRFAEATAAGHGADNLTAVARLYMAPDPGPSTIS